MADPTPPPALPLDPATLDDDVLAALTTACRVEQEKRQRRTQIPDQVTALANVYKHAGGDEATLTAAIGTGFDANAQQPLGQ